jgi:hypothetical protein
MTNPNQELLDWAVDNIREWDEEYTHLRSDDYYKSCFYTSGDEWDVEILDHQYFWVNCSVGISLFLYVGGFQTKYPQVITKEEWLEAKRHASLDELTQLGQEMGEYDAATPEGYKIGDRFVVVCDGDIFHKGSIIYLYKHAGSRRAPLFKLVSGGCQFDNADGEPGAWFSWRNVKPLGKAFTPKSDAAANAMKVRIESQCEWNKVIRHLLHQGYNITSLEYCPYIFINHDSKQITCTIHKDEYNESELPEGVVEIQLKRINCERIKS